MMYFLLTNQWIKFKICSIHSKHIKILWTIFCRLLGNSVMVKINLKERYNEQATIKI